MRKLETVGVVGFGAMGRQIARLCAQYGLNAVILKVTPGDAEEKIRRALDDIKNGKGGLTSAVEKGKMTQEEADAIMGRITATTDWDELCSKSDYVVESVLEDMDLKRDIFKKLDSKTDKDVVLASNTSSLPITFVAGATQNPERVITAHFSQPVLVMKILEISLGRVTSDEAFQQTKALGERLERIIAVARDMGTGVPTTRLSNALFAEAMNLLEEGIATPRSIDTCARYGYGHPMGPLEMRDQITGWEIVGKLWDGMFKTTNDPKWRPPMLLKQMLELGYIGNPARWKGSRGGIYELYCEKRIGED